MGCGWDIGRELRYLLERRLACVQMQMWSTRRDAMRVCEIQSDDSAGTVKKSTLSH